MKHPQQTPEPIEVVLSVPAATHAVLQAAAIAERSKDLSDWILLAAWRRSFNVAQSADMGAAPILFEQPGETQ